MRQVLSYGNGIVAVEVTAKHSRTIQGSHQSVQVHRFVLCDCQSRDGNLTPALELAQECALGGGRTVRGGIIEHRQQRTG